MNNEAQEFLALVQRLPDYAQAALLVFMEGLLAEQEQTSAGGGTAGRMPQN